MQILITYNTYTLVQYYHKIKNEGFEFIRRFFDHTKCPICGAYHCCKFLGFYSRPVFDEHGTFFKDFLIARFECLRKGSNLIVQHKTFSLLPYQLIPYCKYSIPFIFKILEMNYTNNKSTMKIQELLSKYEDANGYIELAQSTMFKFKNPWWTEERRNRIEQYRFTCFMGKVSSLAPTTKWSSALLSGKLR